MFDGRVHTLKEFQKLPGRGQGGQCHQHNTMLQQSDSQHGSQYQVKSVFPVVEKSLKSGTAAALKIHFTFDVVS